MRFLIHGEDMTYLSDVFGVTWFLWNRLFFGEAEVYYKENWKDLAYPVFLDGEAFQDYCRAVSSLYFLFKRFQEVVNRWPRVYIFGPKGGLKKINFEWVKLESDKCVENAKN